MPDQVGKDRRNVLPEMGTEEQADSLDEEEVAIVMKIDMEMEILWDFSIRTDHVIEVRRPDLVLVDKKEEKL